MYMAIREKVGFFGGNLIQMLDNSKRLIHQYMLKTFNYQIVLCLTSVFDKFASKLTINKHRIFNTSNNKKRKKKTQVIKHL